MALTVRQSIAYTDLVDIYKQAMPGVTANKWTKELTYPAQATYSSVQCLWCSSNEDIDYSPVAGRVAKDDLFTLEIFHFDVTTDINDDDYLQIKTVGHPEYGKWYQVKGFGKQRVSRGLRSANYVRVFAQRMITPPIEIVA